MVTEPILPDESYYRTRETTRLDPPQPWHTDLDAICPGCNEPVPSNGRYCDMCGARLIPPTIHLVARAGRWLPENPRPLIGLGLVVLGLVAAGIAWRAAIFSAGFQAGWAAGHAAGALQPWVDARGWVALLVFSIAGTSFLIWRQNKIDATCAAPAI